ncbi:low temperature requirement protein A [Micromonospora sp. 4G57]|uniref:Low temperature requirement protein A n=1 Tax=Micromonospora sicca TaxID=2202420 RepID=A0ABU5JIK6_9ACTN|nr:MULTISPECIES: low temperature requirement protein A [unclassified Micromonospora]MDZ5445851.1 low temperature requirement protein A [Micromonospora sp. 4G57]MDZ5492462.1 low temperature requirement protein A [Micromonospora sp. 4G53]
MGHREGGGQVQDLLQRREDVRQANFLELFIDLALVFALAGVVSRVARDIVSEDLVVRWRAMTYLLVLALPLIWLWITTAHITSWFDPRRRKIQWIVLASAFGLLVMSTSLPYAFVGRGWAFVLPYVILLCGRPLILMPALRGHPLRQLYRRSVLWCAASAVIWSVGAAVSGGARAALWGAAVTVDIVAAQLRWPVPGMARRPVSAWAMDSGHHLPERYQQFLMIALGETVLAVGATLTYQPATAATAAGLVVAFLSTVLLWRIYFYRSGHVLAEAVAAAGDREAAGRATGTAHVVMVMGIVAAAVGFEIVLKHPNGRPEPAWLVAILGGPALFLYGRIRLERVVFDRLSIRRVVAIAALAVAAVPLHFAPPLAATVVAALVLLAVALADARHAAGRPPEAPSPAH